MMVMAIPVNPPPQFLPTRTGPGPVGITAGTGIFDRILITWYGKKAQSPDCQAHYLEVG